MEYALMFYALIDESTNIFPFLFARDLESGLAILEKQRSQVTNSIVRPLYIDEECETPATSDNIIAALQQNATIMVYSNTNANNGWLYRIDSLDFVSLYNLLVEKEILYAG
jgi:hypothetical protein